MKITDKYIGIIASAEPQRGEERIDFRIILGFTPMDK